MYEISLLLKRQFKYVQSTFRKRLSSLRQSRWQKEAAPPCNRFPVHTASVDTEADYSLRFTSEKTRT